MFILSLCGLNHQIKDLLQPSICPFCNHIAFTVRFFKCFLKIMFSGGKIVWPVKKTLLHWLDAAKTTAFMWMSRRNPEMASKVLPNFSWLHFFLLSFFFKSFSLRSLMRCFPYSLASVIVACFASSWRICLAYLIMVSLGSFFTVKFRIWAIQMELQSPTTGSYIGCSISYKARVMLFPISPWGITQAKFLSMCVH